jgi:hypothetical protein
MGKPKDRNSVSKLTKDTKISLRTNSDLLNELKNKTNNSNNSKAIEEAIKECLRNKLTPETDYACMRCGKKIFKQEIYFADTIQLELRTDTEIIITKSEVKKILCLKCAKRNKENKAFIESEEDGKGELVSESERGTE